jgi:hypothetical protein
MLKRIFSGRLLGWPTLPLHGMHNLQVPFDSMMPPRLCDIPENNINFYYIKLPENRKPENISNWKSFRVLIFHMLRQFESADTGYYFY